MTHHQSTKNKHPNTVVHPSQVQHNKATEFCVVAPNISGTAA